MARDSKLFQEALKRGSAYAWNEEWNRAAEQYRLALQEFPDDVSTRTYLAMALYKSGEYRQSLLLYQSLWNNQPSNLTMLQRVAELQEAVGEYDAAAISYGRLADAHTRRRSPRDAFKAWQKVVELSPGNPLLWSSLIEMAVQAGAVKEVIPGYLGLARDLALQSRFQEAIQIVERAVSLDPTNPLAMSLLTGIRRAMEYWWRATGLGEVVLPEDLERLIPRVQVQVAAQSPAPVEPPTMPIPHGDDVPEPHPAKEDRPTITVYASNVTLSMDRSGSISIQGETASASPTEGTAGGLTWQEFEALSSQPPADESQASPSEEPAPSEAGELADTASPAGDEPAEAVSPGVEEPESEGFSQVEVTQEESGPGEAAAEMEKAPEPVATDEPETPEPEAYEAPERTEVSEEELGMTEMEPAEAAEIVPEEAVSVEAEQEPAGTIGKWELAAVPSQEDATAVLAEEEPLAGPEEEPAVVAAEEEPASAAEDHEQISAARQDEAEAVVEQNAAAESTVHEDDDHVASEASDASERGVAPDVPGPDEEPVGVVPDATEGIVEQETVVEQTAVPSWKELLQEAEVARGFGELLKAVDLYEQSIAAGAEESQQFVGLGEVHEQLGLLDKAAHAFAQALELSPELPQALLGLARIDLLNHKVDSAELEARRALVGTPGATGAEASAVELLLDVLRERAAYGDLGGATEALAWLQSSPVADRLPSDIAERIARVSLDLLGRSVAEHLDEIVVLPKHVRGDVASALSKAEKQMEEKKLRSAADEMYRLVSLHPDFLPAQSVLGKILLAQGRLDEASDRARRLLELYELREKRAEALEVLLWLVRARIGTPEDIEQLENLLQTRNRAEEMETIRLELSAPQEVAVFIEPAADERPVADAAPAGMGTSLSDEMGWNGLLPLAESKYASGDVEGAVGLLESALQTVDAGDAATTAALLRVLQLVDFSTSGHRDALLEILEELGLPEDLTDQ